MHVCWVVHVCRLQENAFELVFAFDEVLANGYRDNVTLSQIKTSLEMESYEEKVHRAESKHAVACSCVCWLCRAFDFQFPHRFAALRKHDRTEQAKRG
jgi:hypothetical protein